MPRQSALLATLAVLLLPLTAAANPTLGIQVDQHGDFVLIGNTLAHECGDLDQPPAIPEPVVGTVGECPEISVSAPDVYFRADDPSDGEARAAADIQPTQARTTAVLQLPSDAKVTHARLYWGSYATNETPDGRVRIERPSAGLDQQLTAAKVWTVKERPSDSNRFWYHAAVDVTAIVKDVGAGPFRVSAVSSVPLDTLQGDFYGYVAWYLVVFYEKASEPQRNLALFEGLDLVEPDVPTSVTLSGFFVPPKEVGYDAKLGVVAFEGDAVFTGDGLRFGDTPLENAQNPVDNFFNSTRSAFGAPVSVEGDLPQLTGTPRSMSGIDMDVLDVSSLVQPGQSSATLEATSTLDTYLMTAFVTSIATLKPSFQSSEKTIRDVNGGLVLPGDELEYTITAKNTGSDTSTQTVLRDEIPEGTSYVPGSIQIGGSQKSDQDGDDEAEYDAGARTIVARLGRNASAAEGGSLAIGESASVRFRVKIEAATRGIIRNQGVLSAAGERGAANEETRTDGDITESGTQPTDIPVDVCDGDSDCQPDKPLCDVHTDPPVCVGCVTSLDCNEPNAPDCSTETHTCGCAAGNGRCQTDSDGDGISDDGERIVGSDPNDADTDDDGTPDGGEISPEIDTDNDGLSNVRDADSDNDGLFDGTEQGYDCDHRDTNRALGRCRPDADRGDSKSSPLLADTDKGGVSDGSEDWNLNGVRDDGETDPSFDHGEDDEKRDADGDGVSDDLETFLHSDKDDADSDDDGVPDGAEANPSEDTDLDRRTNVRDVDSDDDGLFDGTELGRDCNGPGTAADSGHCVPDADRGETRTSPLLRDTDGGGVRDGSEDVDVNGRRDGDETDPTSGHGADDGDGRDSDDDGLSDDLERRAGSSPDDADS
ncbi:MAG: DUF3344 domain-containing protein, partial [Polyangiales bacterium]